MALLDSGCTKTVCGETWLQHYLHSLSFDECKKNETSKRNSSFKFGDSKLVNIFKIVKISVIIAGVQATVTIDVVEYGISLLLIKLWKKQKHKQTFRDKINIFGIKVKIYFTSRLLLY